MPAAFTDLNFQVPFVRDEGNTRTLHFTLGEIQSSMRMDRPDALQVDYTRTMMGFLLLNPRPRRLAMVGLGGGSLVKFCHRYLAGTDITVVENNPGVIAMRRDFGIPDDDARLRVVANDGAVFLRTVHPGAFDVLLVDGFDATGQPEQLCSQAFYDDCFKALAAGGVLVLNLHADHPQHELFLQRVTRTFGGNAMQVLAPDKSNSVVFAGRRRPVTLPALRSVEWARVLDKPLQRHLRGEFAHIGWCAQRAS